jgi:galactitol-specific phosphotransferase system IIB component
MPKFTIIQTYKMQDIWKNVEAKNKEEAVDICMAGKDVDENNPDYTNDIIEVIPNGDTQEETMQKYANRLWGVKND